jgi:hypothetical protein
MMQAVDAPGIWPGEMAVASAEGRAADELAVLRRLIGHLMSPGVTTALDSIGAATRFALQATYFVLDVDPAGDAETFVTAALGRLLRQLDHATEQRRVVHRDRVRGRVSWSATFTARFSRDFDPGLYVCREVRRQFDTPENRLLKYVVERIYACVQAMPEALQGGMCYLPAAGAHDALGTADRLARMRAVLRHFRQHAGLRDVPLLPSLDDGYVMRAEASRRQEYAMAAHLFRRHRAMMASAGWQVPLAAVGRRALPLPARVLPDGDLWIRLGAALLQS